MDIINKIEQLLTEKTILGPKDVIRLVSLLKKSDGVTINGKEHKFSVASGTNKILKFRINGKIKEFKADSLKSYERNVDKNLVIIKTK